MIGFTEIGLTQIFRNPSGLRERQSYPCLDSQEASVLGEVGVFAAKEAIFLAICEKGKRVPGMGAGVPLLGTCSWEWWGGGGLRGWVGTLSPGSEGPFHFGERRPFCRNCVGWDTVFIPSPSPAHALG